MSSSVSGTSWWQNRTIRALAIGALLTLVPMFGAIALLTRSDALNDGPLTGFNGGFGETGIQPDAEGLQLTYGCQVLSNEGDLPILITKIELLIKDDGWSVDQGPLLLPGLPSVDYGIICSDFGTPRETFAETFPQAELHELPADGWVLDPGEEQLGVIFGITHNGDDRAVITGHRVSYSVGGQSYEEDFRSELVICQNDTQPCEPEGS